MSLEFTIYDKILDDSRCAKSSDKTQIFPDIQIRPFQLGLYRVVIGIFIIAKIIELLLKHFESYTYCAILGLVISSPVVILMGTDMARVNVIAIITGIIAFAAGALAAKQLGK